MSRRLLATVATVVIVACALLVLPRRSSPPSVDGPGAIPAEWHWRQRAFPHGDISLDGYRLALRQASDKEREAAAARASGDRSAALTTVWQQAGPTNVGARVTDLAVHPDNADVCFAAMASGGVFKTSDGGQNWLPLFQDQDVATVGDIAVDPQQPDVLYVGTGEANAASLSFFGNGLYRSPDGGVTWQHLGLAETRYIARVIVDPTDSDRLYVAATGRLFGTDANRGVYRSTDGGDSWDRAFALTDSTACIDLIMHPTDPDVLYAAMWERVRGLNYRRSGGPSSGVWRSQDGGDTWFELTSGLPTGGDVGRIGLTLCQSQPDVMYAIYADADAGFEGVYKSTDGGDSWQTTNDGPLWDMYSTFGWYFGQIRVEPTNPNNVFAMGVYMYRSTDGGANWDWEGSNMHVDHHALEFAPSLPSRVYQGNDGGLYRSDNSGGSWDMLGDQPTNQFYAVEIDALDPTRLYGGTQDNGTLRTPDGGLDTWERIFGGDGFTVIVDHTDSDVIYCEYQFGNLYKSINGGDWFDWAMEGIDPDDRMNWHTPVVMDPVDPLVLYYGSQRVYRSNDGAGSWSVISGDLTDGDQGDNYGTITTIAVDPTNPSKVYAGTDDGHVWRYRALQGDWLDISADLPRRWVTDITVHPIQTRTFYVTFSGLRWDEPISHVYRSDDDGATWHDVSGDLPEAPVHTVIVDPLYPESIYVGSDVGVYWSPDEGQTWQVLGEGLPRVPVFDLDFHPPTRMLAAGTHGRSIFTANAPDAVLPVSDLPSTASLILDAAPNPFNPQTTFAFTLSDAGTATLEVFDSRGRRVASPLRDVLPAGRHEVTWRGTGSDGRELPSGVYLVKLEAFGASTTKKVLVVR